MELEDLKAKRKLEHRLWQTLRSHDVVGRRFLLACSGGADSVALVRAFAAIRPADDLVVAHVHHGKGNAPFRSKAANFVRELCATHQISHVVYYYDGPELKSEKECRDLRRAALEDIRKQTNADLIVTAHHRDDLLETRLIRLIRGTGPEGLRAIKTVHGKWFRPLLETSATELRDYLAEIGQTHLEDPTNSDERFLRNFVRKSWLPTLEKHRSGSSAKIAKSLEGIVSNMHRDEIPKSSVIARPVWENSAPSERLRLVAGCLQAAGQFEMTRGQLEEIRKRLDNRQREFTFELGGCVWAVDVQQIQASRQG